MKKRIACFLLLISLVIGLLPVTTQTYVHAATVSQNNIVARADYLYNLTWTCKQTVSGWRGNYTFSKGTTYHLPYGQPINSGKYIGYGVNIADFLTAANTAGSVFYTSRSTYTGNGSSSVYYAIDCSAFVSLCWGIDRKTTYSLSQVSSSLGAPTTSNISKIQLGDALNSSSAGHVVLVTGLTYSGSTLTEIEITEQTPPQLKRSYYTPSQLASKYSGSYTILRYSGTVPAAPSSDKYYPACDASCETIVAGLNSIGVDSSKAHRTLIAEANGITDYTGTYDQNVALLDLLKNGLLINPDAVDTSTGTTAVVYYPACDSTCETLVAGLNSLGVDSSKEYRTKIAQANGITDYTGTYEQNNTMMNLLLEGKLIDPDPMANIEIYKYFPACDSLCETIVEGLNAIGVDSSKDNRTAIAAVNGMPEYTGTYDENVALLEYLKAGRLRNPDYIGLSGPVTYYPACNSYCASISAGLNDICYDSSFEWITLIAEENGIFGYTGTSEQDAALLDLLKSGKLVNPDPSVSPMRQKYYPVCDASLETLNAGLAAIGVENCFNYRAEIAAANGITGYTGTADQNESMLALLKSGRLIHARYTNDIDFVTVTSGNNGYERGYQGGIAGSGWIVAHGLDVSAWQESSLDFNRIKDAGYDFVILRAGTTNGKDTLFESYYQKARAAGLDIGTYFYTYATTVSDAVADAEDFLSYIDGKTFEYPVYMDYEDVSQQELSSTLSQSICLAFMDKIKAEGYLTGLYTGKHFAVNLPMDTICAQYEYWMAQYPKTGDDCTDDWKINGYTYSDQCGMYQYASKVYINGTYGPYDGNVCYKDYPSIVKKFGFNGYDSCAHSYTSVVTAPTCTAAGYTTYTCSLCGDSYMANQVAALGHNFANGSCTTCGTDDPDFTPDYYLFGYINGSNYACEEDYANMGQYKFVNGKLTVTFSETSYVAVKAQDNAAWYMTDGWQGEDATSVTLYNTSVLGERADKLQVPGGIAVTFTLVVNSDDTLSLSYTTNSCSHSYKSVITAPTCTTSGYTTHTCMICGYSFTNNEVAAVGHSYSSQITRNPTCSIPGVMTYTCSCGDTYSESIPVAEHTYQARVTAPTCTEVGYTTFTCSVCGDSYTGNQVAAIGHDWEEGSCNNCGSVCSHSYESGICTDCGMEEPAEVVVPTITLKYPTLLLEDEIIMSVYFAMDQEVDLSKLGMLTWNDQPTVVSYETADAVIPGAVMNPNGYYSVNTEAIPAKNLGDTIYFCIYYQMDDGSYIYSKQVSYSPKQFAYSQLNGDASVEEKALMVAMLNYGAQAQTYFGYKTDALVNQDLTAAQKALVKSYDSNMLDGIDMPDSSKVGPYAATGGFESKYPTVSLEGAFAINYYFTTSYTPDADVMLFYWTEADYNAATTLSSSNASGRIAMAGTNNFSAVVEGIPAQNLDETIYVVAGYRANGVSYCTGVLPYSIGTYCVSQAASGSAEMKPLASAIAVYSYYANAYFNSLSG